MVISGLVGDGPPPNPDYLKWPEPDTLPAPEILLPPATPQPLPVQTQPDWLGAERPPTGDPRDPGEPEQIVARRLSPAPMREQLEKAEPPRAPAGPASAEVAVSRVKPRSFNEAQQIADRFKAATPVVLDLHGVESDLAKRLIAFASGLTYGLDGGMERLHDRVFLLTPRGVRIPPAQHSRLAAQSSLNRA